MSNINTVKVVPAGAVLFSHSTLHRGLPNSLDGPTVAFFTHIDTTTKGGCVRTSGVSFYYALGFRCK